MPNELLDILDRRRMLARQTAEPRETQSREQSSDSGHPRVDGSNAPSVRIYKPARSAMQSGTANAKEWVVEFEPTARPKIEPLMGWTASRDVRRQVRLTYPTKEQAIDFARRQGWRFTVSEPKTAKPRPKRYADNFLDPIDE